MSPVDDLAEQGIDDMRQEINCTRSAMTDKLEALKDQVIGTVQSAQETVEDSIQIARDAVALVKRNFSIKYQIEQHPWAIVGGCFFAGLVLGGLSPQVRRRSRQVPKWLAGNQTSLAGSPRLLAEPPSNDSCDTAVPHSMSTNWPGFFSQFHDEIEKVKGMAIGYVMGQVRDSIKEAMPRLAPQIDDVMNSVTTKLGSRPVQQHST